MPRRAWNPLLFCAALGILLAAAITHRAKLPPEQIATDYQGGRR